MASMPHYMAMGTNELVATGLEKAVNGLGELLLLTITGVEELVVFAFNVLTSTYTCLITLAIRGSLHVAIDLIEDVTDFLNRTLGDIGNDIHNGIADFELHLNKVIADTNKISSFVDIPTFDVNSSVNRLYNLQLPSGLDSDLTKLNSSIPTFAQVQNFTDNAIRLPFEEIKKLVNGSLPHFTMDRSVFPVPAKESVSFCDGNNGISSFFDALAHIKDLFRKIAIAILTILAILAMIPMGYLEYRRYRSTRTRAELLNQHSTDPMDTLYIASRPYTASAGIAVSTPIKSPRHRQLLRWIIAYATTPAALFVLSLGIAGLFSALCQFILLKSIQKEVPALTHDISQFANVVVGKLDNASVQWANQSNTVILAKNAELNNDIFGWVNTSTTALNDTLNVFVEEMSDALNATFGGTVLYDPIKDVLNCLIGLKVEGIQKGLTWAKDHAHIDLPLFPNDTFSQGAAKSISQDNAADSFLNNPNGETSDAISGAVVRVVNMMQNHIKTEAIVSGCVVIVWLIVLLMGTVRALFLAFGRDPGDELHGLAKGGARSPSPDFGGTIVEEKAAMATDVAIPMNPAPVARRPGDATRLSRADNLANRLDGQEYTLQPRPFPTFDGRQVKEGERFGYAGARDVNGATTSSNQRVSVHPTVVLNGNSNARKMQAI